MSNDKRYTLSLDLSGSEELNQAIDEMIRERCKTVIRQEMDDHIRAVINERLNDETVINLAKDATIRKVNSLWTIFDVSKLISGDLHLMDKVVEKTSISVRSEINRYIKQCVESKLSGSLMPQIIAGITEALQNMQTVDTTHSV